MVETQYRNAEIQRRSKDLETAVSMQDGLSYVEAVDELGLSHDEIDFPLYEKGLAERVYLAALEDVDNYDIVEVSWVALVRFSELERGQSITRREIEKKLSKIRKTGYPIESSMNLKGMNKGELWAYLGNLRSGIGCELIRKGHRDVSDKIYLYNLTRRDEAISAR